MTDFIERRLEDLAVFLLVMAILTPIAMVLP
jgi:hypothetical protein